MVAAAHVFVGREGLDWVRDAWHRMWMRLLLAVSLLALGCGQTEESPVVRGRQVYLTNCIACHAQDPSQDGALGPAVRGASQALLEARIVRAEYPSGYAPKRTTNLMPPQPFLAASVPDLAAYLNAPPSAAP